MRVTDHLAVGAPHHSDSPGFVVAEAGYVPQRICNGLKVTVAVVSECEGACVRFCPLGYGLQPALVVVAVAYGKKIAYVRLHHPTARIERRDNPPSFRRLVGN